MRWQTCKDCGGSGVDVNQPDQKCVWCSGKGELPVLNSWGNANKYYVTRSGVKTNGRNKSQ